MRLPYSDSESERVMMTLENIAKTIQCIIEWNKDVYSFETYYSTQSGMQLLAANCTLITAIGEGINRIMRIMPDFLPGYFPEIPWRSIIGMRNHIAHGYFELDAELVYETIRNDIAPLEIVIKHAISILSSEECV